MKTDETNPQDWLVAAKTRLQSTDRLHAVKGSSPSVICRLSSDFSMSALQRLSGCRP